jgi:hypothetical protein
MRSPWAPAQQVARSLVELGDLAPVHGRSSKWRWMPVVDDD